MVFEIELVDKEESMMAFKSFGFTSAVKKFFNFLNSWAVGKAPENILSVDNLHYSNDLSVKHEEDLSKKVATLSQSLADVREIMTSTREDSFKKLKLIQREL